MKGDIRKVGLISSIYLIGIIVGIVLLIVAGLNQHNVVMAQQPCDNVTQHLENKGYIEPPYEVIKIQTDITLVNESFTYIALAPEESTFWVACGSGRVFNHKPSYSEILGVIIPDNINEHLFIKIKSAPPDDKTLIDLYVYLFLNITQHQIGLLNQTVSELLYVSEPKLGAIATFDQYEVISQFDWAEVPHYKKEHFDSNKKGSIRINPKPGFVINKAQIDQIAETGARPTGTAIQAFARATPAQIESLAEYSWVKRIGESGEDFIEPVKSKGTIFELKPFHFIFLVVVILLILSLVYVKKIRGGRN